MTYRIAYTTSKSGRWQSAYRETFEAAQEFGKAQFQARIYNETTGSLVANLTSRPTTGYADYVQGFPIRSWRAR